MRDAVVVVALLGAGLGSLALEAPDMAHGCIIAAVVVAVFGRDKRD